MSRSPTNITYAERNRTPASTSSPTIDSDLETVPSSNESRSAYTFSDISQIWESGSSEFVFDRDSVKQSILLILGTNKRTRFWRPGYGADIERLLFEPLDYTTANRLQANIINALTDRLHGDSRITISRIEVLPDIDNNQFYVNLLVDVPSLGLRHESIEFGLSRQ
jgi:phage baseplate assembly protein W